MTASTQTISPLRQRMLDDMRMRKLRPKTQTCYIRAVKYLAAFLQRSPDTATAEDLRRFQLHLVDRGVSAITINATITALRFFFEVTLGRDDVMARMSYVRVPQTLPVVLSRDEVMRLIAAASNLKYQTALSIAYGTGQLHPRGHPSPARRGQPAGDGARVARPSWRTAPWRSPTSSEPTARTGARRSAAT